MAQERDGLTDSAILLMSLGTEAAAEVFRHLPPREAEKLGKAMADLKIVRPDLITGVLDRLKGDLEEKQYIVEDTNQYVKSVVNTALGQERASLLIDRIIEADQASGIENLKWMESGQVARLLKAEHPQIVASVLVHLDRDQAAAVLTQLPEAQQAEILYRISTLGGIQPAAMDQLNEVLSKLIGGEKTGSSAQLGGPKTAAELINNMGSLAEQEVLAWIQEKDSDLAQVISDQMFVFGDLLSLDDKALQMVLREVQSDSLVVALKGADAELREKVFKNMSQRAAESLREDLDSKGPVKVSEVESEQKEIIATVKRLGDEGQIMLSTGGGDDAYV